MMMVSEMRSLIETHYALAAWEPSRHGRRLVYLTVAVLAIIGWYGFVSAFPMLSDRITPLSWALAAGWCLVGVVRVDSLGVWVASGMATIGAGTWRVLSLLWFEITEDYPQRQSGSSLIAVAFAGWTLATIGSVAIWGHWLRPDVGTDG